MFQNRPLRTAATAAHHLPFAIGGRTAETAGIKKAALSGISYRLRWWISLPFANRHGGHLLREFKIILGKDAEFDSRCGCHGSSLEPRGPQRSANEADRATACLNLGGE